MAWTEQDLREIEDELKKGSQGVGDVPEAESLDGITSLPAYQEVEGQDMPSIVRAPLELLAAPALEAADKANEAADKAESNATAAQTAANTANEKAELAAQAASDATAAKEEAEAATQSANNAASNAEEKAEAANTAAQDAEKVANNPTYIGTDHYVYVYNKETDSFDKTGIYCKGEPGSSFRVAGEYATLEALKSAVPDGSAVDGFMAVGTEAPYDYYAWVNGEWVSQGKIGGIEEAPTDGKAYGRKNGDWAEVPEKSNVIILPKEILDLTGSSSSEEILAAFGGIDKYKDLFEKLSTNNCLVQIGEPSLGSLRHIYTLVEYTVKFASNKQWGALGFNIYNEEQQLRRLHFYLENNGTTARCGEASTFQLVRDTDVLTKDNTTAYTPTQPYHPATKKYADASSLYKVYNLGLNVADKTGVLLLWEAEKDEYNATVYRGIMMGSFCTIPLNGITQAGTIPLVSMSASFRKVGDNNETVFMYARGSSNIRVAPATVIYNNKDYTALQVEVNGEADIMNFVGYFDRPPLLTWVPYREETGSGEVILNEEINNNIDVFATKEFVYSSNVLTKTNTSSFTPTQPYHPATKAYADNIGYGRTISITTTLDKFLNTANLSGVDAEQRVIDLFGSLDNFKNVVANILANHVRYYFHFADNPNNNCIELGCVNACRANNNSSHELHFIITYYDENNLYTNRISIVVNNDTAASKVIIASLVNSDNVATLTKKTSTEYSNINPKADNTAYLVTDD